MQLVEILKLRVRGGWAAKTHSKPRAVEIVRVHTAHDFEFRNPHNV